MASWPANGSLGWDTTLYAYISGPGRNPITGMFHALAYGDKTRKTSNINLAIAAAKADTENGGIVYVEGGVWTADAVINMSGIHPAFGPYDNTVVPLMGAGHQVTRIQSASGITGYGFLEAFGSARVHIEGISFEQTGTPSTLQYGIAIGRDTTEASTPNIQIKDVYIHGTFTLAGLISYAAEQAHFEDVIVYTNSGPAMVLAGDAGGWTLTPSGAIAPMDAIPYGGGNGVIRLDRVMCTTTRNAANGPSDYPLVIEYTQSFVADSLYTLSGGASLIVMDKRIDQASFRGVHQEFWDTGSVAGATEPYGFHLKATAVSGRTKIARFTVDASTIYTVFSEDAVKVTQLSVRGCGWRSTVKSWNVDLYDADTCDLPSGSGWTATSASETTTPTYRRRNGTVPLVVDTPMQVLKVSQSLDFPSVASGGVQSLTVTVTGAQVGDPVTVNVNPAGLTTGVVLFAGVSATDTVTVKAQNCTAGAVDPAAVTCIITVLRLV